MRLLALLAILSSSVFAGELSLELTHVSSIIKSSKTQYKGHFLFIAQVHSALEKKIESHGEINEVELLTKGKKLEVLIPKSICYEEVKLSFLAKPTTKLEIKNVDLSFFKMRPDSQDYDAFLKADLKKTSSERALPSCKVSRIR